MHEMSLMNNVLQIVLDECAGMDVDSVDVIHLTIGEQRDIYVDYAQGLLQYLARGTVAEHVTLDIKTVPFMVRCTECGEIFKIDTHDSRTWSCPRCGAYQKYRIFCGHEFQVDSLEVSLRKPA